MKNIQNCLSFIESDVNMQSHKCIKVYQIYIVCILGSIISRFKIFQQIFHL